MPSISTITALLAALLYAQVAVAETLPTPGTIKNILGNQTSTTTKPSVELPQIQKQKQISVAQQQIPIKHIRFQGQTAFTNKELNKIIAPDLKARMTLAEIYNIAQQVTRFYRSNGYILATVSLPAQKIINGTIILEVIEGKIEDVKFLGNRRYSDDFLAAQISLLTQKSRLGKIVQANELENALVRLSDLPGISARAAIQPGDEFGTSDINILTKEKPINAFAQLNNYGRKSLGTYQLLGGADFNNPFHLGDLIRIGAALSPENRLSYINGLYSVQIDSLGNRAGLSISHFNYDVDTSQLDIINSSSSLATLSGNGNTYRLFYSYPWYRSLSDIRTLEFSLRRNETSQHGSLALIDAQDDTIDLVELTLYGKKDFSQSTTSYRGALTTNFDQASNNNPASGQRANLRLDVTHEQLIAPQWLLSGRTILSYSPDELTDTERFRLGGNDTVRAYPAAEIAGDYGLFINADITRQFIISGTNILATSVFVDAGSVYQHTTSLGESRDTQIAGLGIGFTFNTNNSMSLKIDYAYPISNLDSSDGNKAHLWASMSMPF